MSGFVAPNVPTVIFKGVDAGPSYFYWRWMDDLDNPSFVTLDPRERGILMDRFDEALPQPRGSETTVRQTMGRALGGLLMNPLQEASFFADMATFFLPEKLRGELVRHRRALVEAGRKDVRPIMRIHPSPSTARLPWELLVVDNAGTRLLEIADIRLEVPVTVRADRDIRLREQGIREHWGQVRDRPVLYVLDPPTGMNRVLAEPDEVPVLKEHLLAQARQGRTLPGVEGLSYVLHQQIDRNQLSECLRIDRPSRLVYVGHVSAAGAQTHRPEAAALHLSDGPTSYGHAEMVGEHRPFTALDVFVGTALPIRKTSDEDEWRDIPVGDGLMGYEIWPIPLRVALLACDSGSDHRFAEAFGLVIALINNGAELVTATRWVLPTDHAFQSTWPQLKAEKRTPTAEMIVAVDAAHCADDPLGGLQDWQRRKLTKWRQTGHPADSPLVWAAIATHYAPEIPADQVWTAESSADGDSGSHRSAASRIGPLGDGTRK